MNDLPLIENQQQLNQIYREIEERVTAARDSRPIWPCQAGCDACCRRLARPLVITAAEWHTLQAGLAQLPAAVQETIGRKIKALAAWEGGSVVCPLLNEEKGMCRVYDHRPAACRMYGYYVAKRNNQWCELIEALSEAGELDGVMLGNYAAVTRELRQQFGEQKSIVDWYTLE